MGAWKPGFASCITNRAAEAPNPRNWEIIDSISNLFNNTCLIDIKYNNCTNYEGRKIILLRGYTVPSLGESLDPHFTENGRVIARFEPTFGGWDLAQRFQELFNQA